MAWIGNCGGTLIRTSDNTEQSNIIVTAAHCVEEYCGERDHIMPKRAILGAHNKSSIVDGQQLIDAARFVCHPKYKPDYGENNVFYGNDIAILKLDRPVSFSKTIQQPYSPPEKGEEVQFGVNGVAVGWGWIQVDPIVSTDLLHQAILPMYDTVKCSNSKLKRYVNGTIQFCAGYQDGKTDVCEGDSGGPWMVNTSGQFVLHGVTSYVGGPEKSCGNPELPGVFLRVSYYIDWIKEKVKEMTSVE